MTGVGDPAGGFCRRETGLPSEDEKKGGSQSRARWMGTYYEEAAGRDPREAGLAGSGREASQGSRTSPGGRRGVRTRSRGRGWGIG